MAKTALEQAIARIEADINRLIDMKQYLLDGAGEEPAEVSKPKRGRKKKAALPAANDATI